MKMNRFCIDCQSGARIVLPVLLSVILCVILPACSSDDSPSNSDSAASFVVTVKNIEVEDADLHTGGVTTVSFDAESHLDIPLKEVEFTLHIVSTDTGLEQASMPFITLSYLGDRSGGLTERHGFRYFKAVASYEPESENRVVHVSRLVQVPVYNFEPGEYRIEISVFDETFDSEQIITVEETTKPDLMIADARLSNNYFMLPESEASEKNRRYLGGAVTASVEVANLGTSTTEDTALKLKTTLKCPSLGKTYELSSAVGGHGDTTYEKLPAGQELVLSPILQGKVGGVIYDLYLNDEAIDDLSKITEDHTCIVNILLDPHDEYEEYDEQDNEAELNIRFLSNASSEARSFQQFASDSSWTTLWDMSGENEAQGMLGLSDVLSVDYNALPNHLRYKKNDQNQPWGLDFASSGNTSITVIGSESEIFDYDVLVRADADHILNLGGQSCDDSDKGTLNMTIEGKQVFQPVEFSTCHGAFAKTFPLFSKDLKINLATVIVPIGPLPVGLSVGTGVTGSVGANLGLNLAINEASVANPDQKALAMVACSFNPRVSLGAFGYAGVGVPIVFMAGVMVELDVLTMEVGAVAELSVDADTKAAGLHLKMPMTVESLNGDFKVFLNSLIADYEETVINWTGLSKDYLLVDSYVGTAPPTLPGGDWAESCKVKTWDGTTLCVTACKDVDGQEVADPPCIANGYAYNFVNGELYPIELPALEPGDWETLLDYLDITSYSVLQPAEGHTGPALTKLCVKAKDENVLKSDSCMLGCIKMNYTVSGKDVTLQCTGLPQGSWTESCTLESWDGETLRAMCKINNDNNNLQSREINVSAFASCERVIWNHDTNELKCGAPPGAPPGDWETKCETTKWAAPHLCAICPDDNGKRFESCLWGSQCETVDVVQGHLACTDVGEFPNAPTGGQWNAGGGFHIKTRNCYLRSYDDTKKGERPYDKGELCALCQRWDTEKEAWVYGTTCIMNCNEIWSQEADQTNGILECWDDDIPKGSWHETCQMTRQTADGRLCAQCLTSDGAWDKEQCIDISRMNIDSDWYLKNLNGRLEWYCDAVFSCDL